MQSEMTKKNKRPKLSKRTVFAAVLIALFIPATLILSNAVFKVQNYYLPSAIMLVLATLPFIMVFEGRKPQAKELVIIAVLVALSVAGRAAFFALPQIKPVVAIAIIAGVCLGGETGFIVGSLSGFLSNFIFGQSMGTPFQMFGFGIIGFLAGVLFYKKYIKSTRRALCIFGAIATFFIYGFVVDIASAQMILAGGFTWAGLVYVFGTSFAFNMAHAVATAVFLLILSKPMIEKLERVKIKYGMMQPSKRVEQEKMEELDGDDYDRRIERILE